MENTIDIKLKPARMYSVEVKGRDVGLFYVKEQWQGMVLLQDEQGQQIIMALDPLNFINNSVLGDIFSDGIKTGKVIKASPDIIGVMP